METVRAIVPRTRRLLVVLIGCLGALIAGYFARLWILATPEQVLQAARADDWARVRWISLIRPRSVPAARDLVEGTTPLLLAAEEGNGEMVRFLVRKGVDVRQSDGAGVTPLQAATASGKLDLVKYFIAHGARLDEMDLLGRGALHVAAAKDHSEIAEFLLRQGANPNLLHHWPGKCPTYDTPLTCAVRWRSYTTVKLLLKYGADPNAPDNDGELPLEIAIGNWVMMDVLLQRGANPNAKLRADETLLQATKSQADRMMQLLREHGAKE